MHLEKRAVLPFECSMKLPWWEKCSRFRYLGHRAEFDVIWSVIKTRFLSWQMFSFSIQQQKHILNSRTLSPFKQARASSRLFIRERTEAPHERVISLLSEAIGRDCDDDEMIKDKDMSINFLIMHDILAALAAQANKTAPLEHTAQTEWSGLAEQTDWQLNGRTRPSKQAEWAGRVERGRNVARNKSPEPMRHIR